MRFLHFFGYKRHRFFAYETTIFVRLFELLFNNFSSLNQHLDILMAEGHPLDSLGTKPHANDYSSKALIHEDNVGFLRAYI